uniref:PDZ and LIM domain protein Zasp n=1 Tax=Mesocestoides corti TaxID=53468 RepID=A0A5K3FYH1_MESCO
MPGQVVTVKLVREDSSTPWGFRLEGGTDVGHPLNIQRVAPGGVAERCGLCSGDLVLRINRSDTRRLTHEQAKMEIIRSSNDFEITVERGGYVPPLSMTTTSTIIQPMSARVEESVVRGVMDNGQQAPSPGQSVITRNNEGRTHRILHSEYNSPMGLYSQRHASASFEHALSAAGASAPASHVPSLKCGVCGGPIAGVMIKVHGSIPVHPDCLKCSQCGINLRSVGYFYINNSLYCELHARKAAPPPGQGLKAGVMYK